ncbi:sugar ABC transporter ATP-binding protein [Kumtagia ephedrae]|uniref:Sugar ABC transporter ATP-binding protein n=1 Tax=Kumtagia ephedrae TaxID=2116701 RepID=A0A2P7SQT4_9HYPH|nr:sugar ABC transporter ATP-binding protein [Mesorhizobium ephedrae]PSJ64797.1 sugar ABC transporter ATP-binding protein [Mesorhizobium ephedrae]
MLLSMKAIDKSFSGVRVLNAASLEVEPGEVMALVGQNGAGKSTMIKILTGAYSRDAGSVTFQGREVHFSSTADSQSAGIATIYQEINLAPNRTVAENIFLAREPRTAFGLVDRRKMRAEARAVLKRFNLDIDVERPLENFGAATRQMVAIARGVTQNAKLVIMDEATSSLDEREVAVLFETVRTLKRDGVATIFISHRLDELYAICDRVTVMRDGRTVAVSAMKDIKKLELVRTMLGKELTAFTAAQRNREEADGATLVEAKNLSAGVRVRDVSLAIGKGEIAGLAGLLGSGRTETARLIYAADRRDGGTLSVGGRQTAYAQPADAIADGIGFVSEDRKVEGIVPEMSVRENLTLAILPRLQKSGIVDRARQQEIVERYIKALGVKCASPEQPIRELSGGNQQKVLLARWLCMNPRLLIVDEPTRGIDVGAKAEILKLLRGLADEGLSVLMISSELEELIAAADHVTVLSDGRSVARIPAAELSEERLMVAMAHQDGEAA